MHYKNCNHFPGPRLIDPIDQDRPEEVSNIIYIAENDVLTEDHIAALSTWVNDNDEISDLS